MKDRINIPNTIASKEDELDNRTPEQKYTDAELTYLEQKSIAMSSGKKVCTVTNIARLANLNRTCFYRPNFANKELNKKFIKLGDSISSWNKDSRNESDTTVLGQKVAEIELLENKLSLSHIQTAKHMKETLRQKSRLRTKEQKIDELESKLEEVSYQNLKNQISTNNNSFFVNEPLILSPDSYLYQNGKYNFHDKALRKSAWEKIRSILVSELKKCLPQRVYLLVGVPCSGKSHWIEQNQFYRDRHIIVIDCCNLTKLSRYEWVVDIKAHGNDTKICAVYFDIDPQVILNRNEQRNSERRIEEKVLQRQISALEPIDYLDEKHIDELIIVRS